MVRSQRNCSGNILSVMERAGQKIWKTGRNFRKIDLKQHELRAYADFEVGLSHYERKPDKKMMFP